MSVFAHIIFLIAILATSPVLADQLHWSENVKDVPERRFSFDDGIYEISNLKGDWYFAKYNCALKGMELVSIESLEEHSAIVAEISAYEQSFWTSGSDHISPNIFYWESTGNAMGPFYNWAPGQPDDGAAANLSLHDCVAMNSSDSFMWHDFDCTTNSLRYICEKRDQIPNEDMSFSFEDSIYSISPVKLSWWRAKFYCRTRGMRLASIESAEENEAVRQGLNAFSQSDNIWISASDLGRHGDFYWDSTGEFFGIFNDWMEYEPVLGQEFYHCVHMSINAPNINDTHRWRNGNCWSQYRFLCESVPLFKSLGLKSKSVGNLENTTEQISLANSFAFRNSYYEISMDKADWYLANLECKLKGMELLSIESLEEQNAIVKELGTFNENFWTSGNAESTWKYDFHWDSTGRLYRQYANWAAGQPDGENAPGNCLVLSHVDGFKWHDVGCQSENLRYICEKKESIEDEAITFLFNENHYEVSSVVHLWWDASRDCRSKGMRLVSIESPEEDAAINSVIGKLSIFSLTWTSAVDFGRDGDFFWESTGEFIGPHVNWAANEPNNVNNAEHCIVLTFEAGIYKWADHSCTYGRTYICESIN